VSKGADVKHLGIILAFVPVAAFAATASLVRIAGIHPSQITRQPVLVCEYAYASRRFQLEFAPGESCPQTVEVP
jgi:hypothetical protein